MRLSPRSTSWALLAAAAATLAGCASPGFDGPTMTRDTPNGRGWGQSPSTVMNSPELMRLAAARNIDLDAPAWYDERNDLRLATESGYISPTYETSWTYGYDQQYESNGRVYNNASTTTYRSSVTQSSR